MSLETSSPDSEIISNCIREPNSEGINAFSTHRINRGWRAWALYSILLFLTIVIFINLGLSLWLLSVMRFSKEGIGPIHIISGGIKLSGKALFADSLVASTIASRSGQPIRMESYRNLTIDTRDAQGNLDNRIFIGRNRFECQSVSFKITDVHGRLLFEADPQEIYVGTDTLSIGAEGGVTCDGSIQTPLVRADSGHELWLESPTRSIEVRAPSVVSLESRAGAIKANSYQDLKLESLAGSIQLDSSNILLPKLEVASYQEPITGRNRSKRKSDIYQLCTCADGKLFLADPKMTCETYLGDYICR